MNALAFLVVTLVASFAVIGLGFVIGEMLDRNPIDAVFAWLKHRGDCKHDGPQFSVTAYYGRAIEGAYPQEVVAWHTCKKCDATYAVKRYETADEFESRQPKATP